MKILLGYSYYPYPYDVKLKVEKWISRLNKFGFNVELYPLTIDPPNHPYYWKKLDRLWKLGDYKLLNHYEKLALKLENFDVFLNWNGINIHPDFIQQLKTFNIYGCFDDPESSEKLSKPVAAAYDLSLIGNIAEIETYKSWGVKDVRFWPIGFMEDEYDPTLTEEKILNTNRPFQVGMLCEKKYNENRIKRLNKYSAAYPEGQFYGAGWEKGFLKEEDKISFYLNTKIGPNFHNSTGPINYRLYTLPANGVMQICDNKRFLGEIFELGKEVIGFNTIEEAIELTNYYLNHDDERKKIAIAGWKRVLKDYNEYSVFNLVEKYVNELKPKLTPQFKSKAVIQFLAEHRRKTVFERTTFTIKNKIKKIDIPENE